MEGKGGYERGAQQSKNMENYILSNEHATINFQITVFTLQISSLKTVPDIVD